MKVTRPYHHLLLGSAIILTGFVLVYMTVSLVLSRHIDWLLFVLSGMVVYFASLAVFHYILKVTIHDRIKLVYKTIHNLKLTKEEKGIQINLAEDHIDKVNQEVREWSLKRKEEMDFLRNQEIYRREYIGNVSHELKTPISSIQGYIMTLLDGALDDPEVNRSYLQKAEKNVERMINIIDDLEIISHLETGELKLNFTRFNIVSLTQEGFDLLEEKASQNGIHFIFQEGIHRESEIFVTADREWISHVLMNLLDNSVKYGKKGGRTKVSYYDMDDNILIEVSDNGIGIEAHHLPRLFERFYRIEKSRSRNVGGSGLGLAIVKHIMESHHQTINVRSTPGVGSTFSFTLKKG
ncbi:MAG: ATP-binding protein [Bacteroidales bacterium]|nr:sensor histidine kinase [Lentimicrobiaceae bacterium]MDD5695503.1 ATP-binding protein [Bacteroidales bacterium]